VRPDRRAVRLRRPINGEAFHLYVDRILAPTLRPGDVVIMDNLGSHKGKAARAATPRPHYATSTKMLNWLQFWRAGKAVLGLFQVAPSATP